MTDTSSKSTFDDDTREALAAAAAGVWIEEGGAAVSFSAVADRSGFARPTIQKWVGNKATLLLLAARWIMQTHGDGAVPTDSPVDAAVAEARAHLGRCGRDG